MNSGDLYALFRSDVVDSDAQAYLWTDVEVYSYMNDAYRMFARLTGGIPDATSDLTAIPVVAGQMYAEVSPLILKFRQAYLVSSGQKVEIINEQDAAAMQGEDYGQLRPLLMDARPGVVRYMMTGLERGKDSGKVRWAQTPAASDVVHIIVYRLPRDSIETGNDDFTFPEIGDEHVENLLLHMKARAYGKQDAETFDRGKRDGYRAEFAAYCEAARAEWERYKHKTRIVRYGGL